jgi:hypothetical protein
MTSYRTVVVAFVFGVMLSAFVVAAFLPVSRAQEMTPQLPGQLQIVTYPSSLTGFFDRNTGMLYLYDADLNKCVCIRQLVQLGEPMRKLRDQGR